MEINLGKLGMGYKCICITSPAIVPLYIDDGVTLMAELRSKTILHYFDNNIVCDKNPHFNTRVIHKELNFNRNYIYYGLYDMYIPDDTRVEMDKVAQLCRMDKDVFHAVEMLHGDPVLELIYTPSAQDRINMNNHKVPIGNRI